MTQAFNRDCIEAMKEFPDDFFDLAVVDPPYGDASGGASTIQGQRFGGIFDRYKDWRRLVEETGSSGKIVRWDISPPEEYWTELFRVSQRQIVWGGNYFGLPPNRNFLIWDKFIPEKFSMASIEYAWTNIPGNAKMFRCPTQNQPGRFHPTQKPVALYEWIFCNYAKPGWKILDTHLGSGSSRIAAHNAGLDFWGYEIDEQYFQKQEERFETHTNQLSMF